MDRQLFFYRCYLERGMAVDGEPGLLAATEVVQAVCDAGFQRNGLSMKCYPSSPHCYYKYAKTPKEGMYMLRAVKKTDMTTIDILIDTRLYPSFVMIEKHTDWQEEIEEVKDTLEQYINDEANKYNWNVNLREHRTNTAQHVEEFISALSYMKDQEDMHEKHHENIHIDQLIMKMDGNNYYNGETTSDVKSQMSEVVTTDEEAVERLKPLFYNNEDNVVRFLKEIEGMPPNDITDLVNQWVKEKLISDYGNSRKGPLWEILKDAGLYTKTRQNWCRRVY